MIFKVSIEPILNNTVYTLTVYHSHGFDNLFEAEVNEDTNLWTIHEIGGCRVWKDISFDEMEQTMNDLIDEIDLKKFE